MRQRANKAGILLLIVLITAISLAPGAYANSAEPPMLKIVVSLPPDDLTLSIRINDGETAQELQLDKEQTVWETTFRFLPIQQSTAPRSSMLIKRLPS